MLKGYKLRVQLTTKEGETGVKPGEVVKPLLNRPPEHLIHLLAL